MPRIKKSFTVRERLLIKGLLAGLSDAEAMRRAGYAESTAKKQSGRTIGKIIGSEPLMEAMDRAGITDEKLLQTLAEGLNATKLVSFRVDSRRGAGAFD